MRKLGGNMYLGAVVGVAAMALAVQASAIELTPYGSIKVATWYNQIESFKTGTGSSYTDRDLSHDIQGNSLFGLRVKEADFSGVFEMGAYNPKNVSGGPEIRLMYAGWDFGAGTVLVGKAPSPYVYRTMQAWDQDGGMNGYGSLYDGRYGQVKVTMKNGLYIDFMQPRQGGSGANTTNVANPNAGLYQQTGNVYPTAAYTDYDTFMPKIVAGYEGKLDKWNYGGGVAFNSYKVTYRATATSAAAKDDITSYLLYFHGKIDLAPVELSYNVFGGRNVGDLMSSGASGYVVNGGAQGAAAASSTGAYYDNFNRENATTYGGWGQIGYTVNDKFKLYAGASYIVDSSDAAKSDDERLATFINAQYQVSKYFRVVPEIDYVDDMKNTLGNKEPKIFAAGVKWEMLF